MERLREMIPRAPTEPGAPDAPKRKRGRPRKHSVAPASEPAPPPPPPPLPAPPHTVFYSRAAPLSSHARPPGPYAADLGPYAADPGTYTSPQVGLRGGLCVGLEPYEPWGAFEHWAELWASELQGAQAGVQAGAAGQGGRAKVQGDGRGASQGSGLGRGQYKRRGVGWDRWWGKHHGVGWDLHRRRRIVWGCGQR